MIRRTKNSTERKDVFTLLPTGFGETLNTTAPFHGRKHACDITPRIDGKHGAVADWLNWQQKCECERLGVHPIHPLSMGSLSDGYVK